MLHVLLMFLPALALAGALLARRYPGERVVLRLSRRRAPANPRPARPARELPRQRPTVLLARGGELIARALAVRPPPPGLLGAAT